MDVKEQILHNIQNVLEKITGKKVYVKIDHPQDPIHGDYSTNVALVVFPKLKGKFKNPLELAVFIAKNLQKKLPNIDRIEASKPGFINFWVSEKDLLEELDHISTLKDNFGKDDALRNQKIILEFADPNPFKEFHIGHLRNISLGESYARLLEFQGATVWRVNYQGDVGMHVAKAIWGMKKLLADRGEDLKAWEVKKLQARIQHLGLAYSTGARAYDEDEKAKEEIQKINVKLYEKDSGINILWEKGRQWSLDHFEEIYKRVGTVYKKYYFESQTAQVGKELVLSKLPDGIFEKHEGAIIFRGSHTRVFVTTEDYATYEAKDLGLAKIKYEDFKYDESIIITANEQDQYFKVVLEAMAKVLPDLAKKTKHDSFGFVSLKDIKMSSRLGNIITGEWLLDEAKKRIKAEFKDMDGQTLEKVAVGAVKYSMLKFSRKSDITFSFDESISLEGNSGPYLQYTYARTQSVLARSQIRNPKSQVLDKLETEEALVLRLIIHFPEVVKDAADNFSPNLLCNYLFDLSQKFNNFYQKHKILGSEKEDFRLALTSAVGQILKTGLYLLGIEAPEKM